MNQLHKTPTFGDPALWPEKSRAIATAIYHRTFMFHLRREVDSDGRINWGFGFHSFVEMESIIPFLKEEVDTFECMNALMFLMGNGNPSTAVLNCGVMDGGYGALDCRQVSLSEEFLREQSEARYIITNRTLRLSQLVLKANENYLDNMSSPDSPLDEQQQKRFLVYLRQFHRLIQLANKWVKSGDLEESILLSEMRSDFRYTRGREPSPYKLPHLIH